MPSQSSRSEAGDRRSVPALRVNQWLRAWNSVAYEEAERRRKPEPWFLVFSLPAHELRRLCGIRRRSTEDGAARATDLGIQRRHDEERSEEIAEYVRHGFPWSDLGRQQKRSHDFDDLKKPGWLPSAVVVNIINAGENRSGRSLASNDALVVRQEEGKHVEIDLPVGFTKEWSPSGCEPVEVIDGQHRLWAFEKQLDDDNFELPVVAFVGLDVSWQAYLFWTINIKPKKINPSLAFDLYPLLRTEDWLERFQGVSVYRETRAQELTEALWSYPESPWYRRINMLGERGVGGVTQAAWIRSLTSTFIRASEGRGVKLGGLFGAPVGEDELTLPWTRAQQAAFLVLAWTAMRDAIAATDEEWAVALREDAAESDDGVGPDAAFAGRETLLNTDQGVRAFLHVTNDICVLATDRLRLADWVDEGVESAVSTDAIGRALASLDGGSIANFLAGLAAQLASFDWRTSAAPGLSEGDRAIRTGFRGAGGYRDFRRQLLRHLERGQKPHSTLASDAIEILGLDD